MVTVPILPLGKLRPDDLPRVTQLLDELAFPSQPLYQGQSLPTLFSMSPLVTQITAFKALWLPGFREPRLLTPAPAEVWNGEVLSQACQQAEALSLTCPGNRTLQTGLSDCPGGKTVTSLATAAGASLALCSSPPASPPSAGFPLRLQGGEEPHAHQEGSLRIKASSVMSKAEGRNLVHFIIEVIQLF